MKFVTGVSGATRSWVVQVVTPNVVVVCNYGTCSRFRPYCLRDTGVILQVFEGDGRAHIVQETRFDEGVRRCFPEAYPGFG